MKKKFVSILAAALLVFGITGQAMAALWGTNEIIRVVYKNSSSEEVANSLFVSPYTFDWSQTNVIRGDGDILGVRLSDFGAGTTWADLKVAYFAIGSGSTTATQRGWVSDTITSPEVKPTSVSWNTFTGAVTPVRGYYDGLTDILDPAKASQAKVIGSSGNQLSYWNNLDANGVQVGKFGGAVEGIGEISLAALAQGGIADLNFYVFDGSTNWSGQEGVLKGVIRTSLVDGEAITIINPVVPIPGALWLLGSGLLGLIGLRRKSA